MTDEQIKKAMTNDLDNSVALIRLESTPETLTSPQFIIIRNSDVLDLINRQQEELEYLRGEREVILEDMQVRNNQVIEQQAEIERLKEELEIRNQKRANIFEILNTFERGRTEAIKEFEAKIHEKLRQAEMHGNFEPVVTREMFDSVVKELVGEQK